MSAVHPLDIRSKAAVERVVRLQAAQLPDLTQSTIARAQLVADCLNGIHVDVSVIEVFIDKADDMTDEFAELLLQECSDSMRGWADDAVERVRAEVERQIRFACEARDVAWRELLSRGGSL